jgi:hypothetical protein
VAHVVARYSLFQAPVPVHHICKSVLLGSDTPDKTFIEHRCRISALAATECNPLSASWNTCFQVQKMGRNSANATCMCLEDDLDQMEKIDTVTILNELAHKLMSALVSEICFSVLLFKTGHHVQYSTNTHDKTHFFKLTVCDIYFSI